MYKFAFVILVLLTAQLFAQDGMNTIVEIDGRAMLVGHANREAFADTNFAWWFDAEYTNYEPDSAAVSELTGLDEYDITIVMGTWCSDSRREVPRFYKILDMVDYPEERLTLIGVDRDKKGMANETEGLDIQFVPTFILYKDGEEAGRIIETPVETLEEDLANIINE